MLIRITQNSAGIEHYFEAGQKNGREQTRDMLDERVHLLGNLSAFSAAVTYTRKHKNWKEHYWHITASFAIEDNKLDMDTLRLITQDIIRYYCTGYSSDNLVFAAEAHLPKIQSELNKTTQQQEQRLLHLHLALSKWDRVTDNQIRMIPFKLQADKAFQSHLAEKYKLVDPADRKRKKPISKADIFKRWNASEKPISKQTQVAKLRAQFSELVSNSSSIEEAKQLLMQSGLVAKVMYKEQKSGNRYLQVKTTLGTRNINLRGIGFEQLESFYYSADELALQLDKKKSQNTTKAEAQESHQSISERHQKWWIAQEKKRTKAKPIKYEETQKKYEKKFTERLKEARIYYVLYHDNIEEHLIKGYQIWEKNNTRYLFNNDLGVKLYDQPNKITLQMPDDPIKRCNAVALMLAMAQSKGWNINKLKMTGSEAFKSEVKQQIAIINQEKNRLILAEQQDHQVGKASIAPKPQSVSPIKPKLNAIDQAIKDNKQTNARKLSKEQIASIKTDLDAQTVIDYAVKELGLIAKHFSVTKDNKIDDDRLKSKPRNVIDFLTKTCNLKFTDVMPLLEQMLEVQTEKQEQKLGFQ